MYIPNFYGIIKQPGENVLDLIAMPFFSNMDLDIANISVLYPEYEDGYYYTQSGTKTAGAAWCAGELDLTGYDYVIMPMIISSGGTSVYTGLRSDPDSGTLNPRVTIGLPSGDFGDTVTAWMLVAIGTKPHLFITNKTSMHIPVAAIKISS